MCEPAAVDNTPLITGIFQNHYLKARELPLVPRDLVQYLPMDHWSTNLTFCLPDGLPLLGGVGESQYSDLHFGQSYGLTCLLRNHTWPHLRHFIDGISIPSIIGTYEKGIPLAETCFPIHHVDRSPLADSDFR